MSQITNPASVLLPGFVGTELPEWLAQRLRGGLAGVCLFAENIVDTEQLRTLTAAIREANPAALIAIDEEGGDVTRLHAATGSPFPGNAVLGRLDDLELTAAVGRAVAEQLRAVGIDLNFAPDADVNSNPNNPVIGIRSFGADPELVGRHAAAWVAAHEAAGVAVSVKHFPGHGDTAADSHHAMPVVDLPLEVLKERELVPFAHAIAAGARTIMSSHILLPQLDAEQPATFSPRILRELLRDEYGFTGVVVSDALDMAGASGEIGIPAAAVRAIHGGCDLLCIGTKNTAEQMDDIAAAIEAALESGELLAERLADASRRTAELAAGLDRTHAARPDAYDIAPRVVVPAFDIRDGVRIPAGALVLALETEVNVAVGVVPWGLDSVGVEVTPVHEGDALPAHDGPYLVVGKDVHRHAWTRAIADAARAAHPQTVVIDMGWPEPTRAYADIATFGASRSVSAALRTLVEGTTE